MPTPYYQDESVTLHHGDCLDVMASLPDSSVDSIVTDPPYGLGFMGKAWDSLPPGLEWAEQCLRVLKPGGHMLAFGGTRTWHRLVVSVEDGGFEIRDSIAWLYGSGFPKSLDVSKAIDKAAGVERAVVSERFTGWTGTLGGKAAMSGLGDADDVRRVTAPATDAAKQWQGWGTALKPAFEPIVVGRKPLIGTVTANIQQHGTGALNIDACRTGAGERPVMVRTATTVAASSMSGESTGATPSGEMTTLGRWPSNVILDESQADELDKQSGTSSEKSRILNRNGARQMDGWGMGAQSQGIVHGDTGGASRFFPTFRYEAKAPGHERPTVDDTGHPTVKPLDLMRWLVRLVTPPGGLVLDPFLGSGTTAEACIVEGFRCIGIERDVTYLPLIVARLSKPIEPVLDFGTGA